MNVEATVGITKVAVELTADEAGMLMRLLDFIDWASSDYAQVAADLYDALGDAGVEPSQPKPRLYPNWGASSVHPRS